VLQEGIVVAGQTVPLVGGDGGDPIYDLGRDTAKPSRPSAELFLLGGAG
jgi:hypothetical protein